MAEHLDVLAWEEKGGIDPCECPDDLADREPDRNVAQWIENTFYVWDEYVLLDADGNECVCVVMERPSESVLTVEEAEVLLSASMLWTRSAEPDPGEMEVLAADDPDLDRMTLGSEYVPSDDGEVTRGESRVIPGLDDRERVTDTTTFPWNTVTYVGIEYFFEGFGTFVFRGSAFVASPHTALTAGHIVYALDTGSFATNVFVAPGQRQDSEDGDVTRPYGTRDASEIATLTNFIESSELSAKRIRHDLGAIHFDSPFDTISTYLPVEFGAALPSGRELRAMGYPAEARGESNSQSQWLSAGQVGVIDPWRIMHNLYVSGGNSGGPTVAIYPGGTRRVVGVVSAVARYESFTTRFTPLTRDVVLDWMAWTPSGTPPPDPGPEPEPTQLDFAYPAGFDTLTFDSFTTVVNGWEVEQIIGESQSGETDLVLTLVGRADNRGRISGMARVLETRNSFEHLAVQEFPIRGRFNFRGELIAQSGSATLGSARVQYVISGSSLRTRAQVRGSSRSFDLMRSDNVIPVTAQIVMEGGSRTRVDALQTDPLITFGIASLDTAELQQLGRSPYAFGGFAELRNILADQSQPGAAQLRIRPYRWGNPAALGSIAIRTETGRLRALTSVPSVPSGSESWADQPMEVEVYHFRAPGYSLWYEWVD